MLDVDEGCPRQTGAHRRVDELREVVSLDHVHPCLPEEPMKPR